MCVVVPRSSWDEALATVFVPVSVRCGTLPLSVGGAWRAKVCAGCVLCWNAGGVSVALCYCMVVLCHPSDRTVAFHMHGTESTMHLGTSLHPLCAVLMLCCCGEEVWRGPNQVESSTVVVTRGPGRFK